MYYCIANWKMNPIELREAEALFEGIKSKASRMKNVHTVVCPTYVHLTQLAHSYKGKKVSFGSQDVYFEKEGSFTGNVSAYQVKNAGADYCIIGHSERRAAGETGEEQAKKIKAALHADLTPIFCFGEKMRDSEGHYLNELTQQLTHTLKDFTPTEIERIIFAYEPVWAIGRSAEDAMSSYEMHQTALYTRKIITECANEKVASGIRILYGGSVESTNAEDLIKNAHVDGFLVGHASLNATHFGNILEIMDNAA